MKLFKVFRKVLYYVAIVPNRDTIQSEGVCAIEYFFLSLFTNMLIMNRAKEWMRIVMSPVEKLEIELKPLSIGT